MLDGGYISPKKTVRVVLDVHLENPDGSPGESAEIKHLREWLMRTLAAKVIAILKTCNSALLTWWQTSFWQTLRKLPLVCKRICGHSAKACCVTCIAIPGNTSVFIFFFLMKSNTITQREFRSGHCENAYKVKWRALSWVQGEYFCCARVYSRLTLQRYACGTAVKAQTHKWHKDRLSHLVYGFSGSLASEKYLLKIILVNSFSLPVRAYASALIAHYTLW